MLFLAAVAVRFSLGTAVSLVALLAVVVYAAFGMVAAPARVGRGR